MRQKFSLLHTAQVHIATFNAFLAEMAPDVDVEHIVNEDLLQQARALTDLQLIRPALRNELLATNNNIVLCTCSTLGGLAEEIGIEVGKIVIRVDRPMIEKALTYGEKLLVVVTTESTLAPTQVLIDDILSKTKQQAQVEMLLVPDAWQSFSVGDSLAYYGKIADAIRAHQHPVEEAHIV